MTIHFLAFHSNVMKIAKREMRDDGKLDAKQSKEIQIVINALATVHDRTMNVKDEWQRYFACHVSVCVQLFISHMIFNSFDFSCSLVLSQALFWAFLCCIVGFVGQRSPMRNFIGPHCITCIIPFWVMCCLPLRAVSVL